MTHTYAVLDVSPETYNEIRTKLETAGYQHAFNGDEIDMHGIGLRAGDLHRLSAIDPPIVVKVPIQRAVIRNLTKEEQRTEELHEAIRKGQTPPETRLQKFERLFGPEMAAYEDKYGE